MRNLGKRTLSGSLEVIVVALMTLVRPAPNPAVATTIAKELIKLLLESRIAVRRRRWAAAFLERASAQLKVVVATRDSTPAVPNLSCSGTEAELQ